MKRKDMKRKIVAFMMISMVATGAMTACGTAADTANTTDTADTVQEVAEEVELEADTASADQKQSDEIYLNSYDNTEELDAKFPTQYPTATDGELENNIKNRLLTGFENWNRGYDAWEAWGNILYTDDSIYNVHGARLTLAEYQAAMDMMLGQVDIQMGDFKNMIICDDWAAIHYEISTNGHPGTTMEFVKFKDYGDELGVRVVEGWGGPKDDSYESMCMFQSEEGSKIQQEDIQALLDYEIPQSDDLTVKYPVMNPTSTNAENADEMTALLLKDFDSWNLGFDEWSANAKNFFTEDATITTGNVAFAVDEYCSSIQEAKTTENETKLYYDSMLIKDDWAAIHYRYTDMTSGTKEVGDAMEFYHFVKDGDSLKVDTAFLK